MKFEGICKKVAGMFVILTQILRHQILKVGKIAAFSDFSQVEDKKIFSQEDTLSRQFCINSF